MKNINIIFLWGVVFLLSNNAMAHSRKTINHFSSFTDVTVPAGLGELNQAVTYSAAVADYNLDGYIDILISHHNKLSLWTNNGNGTFKNSTSILAFNRGDLHGVSFIDINDDGYPDILVACGADRGRGEGTNLILINQGGKKFSRLLSAPEIISDMYGRGRSITPTDLNADGRIDLLLFNYYQKERPNRIAMKTDANLDYHDYAPGADLGAVKSFGMKVVDLNNDGHKFYIATGPGVDSGKIYSQINGHFKEVSGRLGIKERNASCVPFDYDDDGDFDLLFTHHNFSKPVGVDLSSGKIMFNYVGKNARKEFKAFGPKGRITIKINFEEKRVVGPLFLGKYARKSDQNPWKGKISSPSLLGKPHIDATSRAGVYIWSDGKGYLHFIYIGSPELRNISGYISADEPGFTSMVESYQVSSPQLEENSFYKNEQGHFIKKSAKLMGLAGKGLAKDTIAADFNNDGLIDLYQVNIGYSFKETNPGNELFMNKGDGTFAEVAERSHAVGPIKGAGNGAIAFDYDNDGDLDLLLYNGFVRFPVMPGPVVLLRNDLDSGEGSISLDLKGISSNSRGWGARIVSTLANKTQYQQKKGFNAYLSTSDVPFHIGLGNKKSVDTIKIIWPSGKTQVLRAIAAGSKILQSEP